MYKNIFELTKQFSKLAQQVTMENVDDQVKKVQELARTIPLNDIVNEYNNILQTLPENTDYSKYEIPPLMLGLTFKNNKPVYFITDTGKDLGQQYPLLNKLYHKFVSPYIMSELNKNKINPQSLAGLTNNWSNFSGVQFT